MMRSERPGSTDTVGDVARVLGSGDRGSGDSIRISRKLRGYRAGFGGRVADAQLPENLYWREIRILSPELRSLNPTYTIPLARKQLHA